MEYPFQEKGFTMSKLSDKISKKVDQFLDWSVDHPILSTVIVTTGATVGMSALSYGVCTAINNVVTRRAIKNTRDIAIPNWSDGCLRSAFEEKSNVPGKNALVITAENVPIESLGKIGGHLESMSGGRDLTEVAVIVGGLVDRNN